MFGIFTIKNSTITFKDTTRLEIDSYSGNYIEAPFVAASIYVCSDHYLIFELEGFQSQESREPETIEEFERELYERNTPYWFDSCHIFYDALKLTYNGANQQFHWLPVRSDIGIDAELLSYALTMTLYQKKENIWHSQVLNEQQLYAAGLQHWEMLGIGMIEKVG